MGWEQDAKTEKGVSGEKGEKEKEPSMLSEILGVIRKRSARGISRRGKKN